MLLLSGWLLRRRREAHPVRPAPGPSRLPDGGRVVPPWRRRTAELLASVGQQAGSPPWADLCHDDPESDEPDGDEPEVAVVAEAAVWLARVDAEVGRELLAEHRRVVADHVAAERELREATSLVPLAPLLTRAQEYRGGGAR